MLKLLLKKIIKYFYSQDFLSFTDMLEWKRQCWEAPFLSLAWKPNLEVKHWLIIHQTKHIFSSAQQQQFMETRFQKQFFSDMVGAKTWSTYTTYKFKHLFILVHIISQNKNNSNFTLFFLKPWFLDAEKFELEWNSGASVAGKRLSSAFPVDFSDYPKTLEKHTSELLDRKVAHTDMTLRHIVSQFILVWFSACSRYYSSST